MIKKKRQPNKADGNNSVTINPCSTFALMPGDTALALAIFKKIQSEEDACCCKNNIEPFNIRHPELIIGEDLLREALTGLRVKHDLSLFPLTLKHLTAIGLLCDWILTSVNPFGDKSVLNPFVQIMEQIDTVPSEIPIEATISSMAMHYAIVNHRVSEIRKIFRDMPKWVDGKGDFNITYSFCVISIAEILADIPCTS